VEHKARSFLAALYSNADIDLLSLPAGEISEPKRCTYSLATAQKGIVEALLGRNSTTTILESHLSGDVVVDCGYFSCYMPYRRGNWLLMTRSGVGIFWFRW
jgi:hypothetical protein